MIEICPSILAADFGNLQQDCQRAIDAGGDMLHVDVMDGHFVPNLSLGSGVLQGISQRVKTYYDVHFMVEYPTMFLEQFVNSGANSITVHLECKEEIEPLLRKISSFGVQVGLAIKPETPVEDLIPYLSLVDMVLIMSVSPGFGGQKFSPHAVGRIRQLSTILKEKSLCIPIQVDGGIDHNTGKEVIQAGATRLVAGSYLFTGDNIKEKIQRLAKG